MDELEISGKRYISSRRAAKDNKYTSDYIGQLIRANKVIGQKVGRSWYVEADSLDAYLRGESMLPAGTQIKVPPVSLQSVRNPEPVENIKEYVEERVVMQQPARRIIESPVVPAAEFIPASFSGNRVNVMPAKEPEKRSHTGLTYLEDRGEMLPEIKKDIIERPVPLHRVEEEVEEYTAEEEPEVFVEAPVARKIKHSNRRQPVVLGVLGLLVFMLMLGGSYFVYYNTSVEGENSTASIILGVN